MWNALVNVVQLFQVELREPHRQAGDLGDVLLRAPSSEGTPDK